MTHYNSAITAEITQHCNL